MDRFRFPVDLIRAQQEWHATYRALAVPRPRRTTGLRRRLLQLSVRIERHPFWSTPEGRSPAARVELRRRAADVRGQRSEGAA
ncbi:MULTISPECIES: hypothetical protein [unclassified Streptomyces]|uniref:hypothetical protein n=1 Tax=unclassified Streptomyces TaxID=2593676 RepID=UPI000823C744|nr:MULTISPECIES: hypothetical protein [unclassified Streptomyces]MYT97342.1 hypothetical protein [Streptomyces sp. SID8350]SCK63050.1 hypothetical protein YUWDRAFT_06775 [Streptomyces sp. AmelKG-D3]